MDALQPQYERAAKTVEMGNVRGLGDWDYGQAGLWAMGETGAAKLGGKRCRLLRLSQGYGLARS